MIVQSPAANQFIVSTNKFSAFQSYTTLIAVIKDGKLYVSDEWDCSRTTLKYFKQFTNLEASSKSDIQKMIDNKEVILLSDMDLHNMCSI